MTAAASSPQRVRCYRNRYRSQFAAECALLTILLSGKRPAGGRCECRVYPCTSCGGWHLTSQTGEALR